jgi:hypothetical protein
VKFTCEELSFQDVASGALPTTFSELCTVDTDATSQSTQVPVKVARDELEPLSGNEREDAAPALDMVICSFALHLVETPSQLFSLLWELSQKARWLIIIAPHKKPDVSPSPFILRGPNLHLTAVRSRTDGDGFSGILGNGGYRRTEGGNLMLKSFKTGVPFLSNASRRLTIAVECTSVRSKVLILADRTSHHRPEFCVLLRITYCYN